MTETNDYTNQASFQLYDTSGSVEDWSYWQTGGLGFTFEIGPDSFHPAYEDGVVAEYLGLEPAAGAGLGGNREAYYRMAEATLDAGLHSTITGTAPAGRTLSGSKQFQAFTSPVLMGGGVVGAPIPYDNDLSSSLKSTGGKFSWAVNPSTRPEVVGRYGREPLAPVQPTAALTNPAGIPARFGTEVATFSIGGLPQFDNARAEVRVQWPDSTGLVDWDVVVFDSEGNAVASAESLANPEVAVLLEPQPGTYTVVVENYEGGTPATDWTGEVVFGAPDPAIVTGIKEAWNLTCTKNDGSIVTTREVIVDRGESVDVGNACKKAKD